MNLRHRFRQLIGTVITRARCVATVALFCLASNAIAESFELTSATIADINAAFDAGALNSERLVELSLARIAAYDDAGPKLNAVMLLNPGALDTARALDAEPASRYSRGS
jgi:hypothetical protein